jgi:hypothetical protein
LIVGSFTVAACFSAVLLTGAAEPADTPTNPIPAAIKVAITILRMRFSLCCPLNPPRGRAVMGRSKRCEVNPESPHRLVFAQI